MTSERRVEFGHAAIKAGTPDYQQNDAQTNATDALANIMHACRHDGFDIDYILEWARHHFEAEFAEEEDE